MICSIKCLAYRHAIRCQAVEKSRTFKNKSQITVVACGNEVGHMIV